MYNHLQMLMKHRSLVRQQCKQNDETSIRKKKTSTGNGRPVFRHPITFENKNSIQMMLLDTLTNSYLVIES